MTPHTQPHQQHKKPEPARQNTMVEDERGWAGQHGQRPANEEEKNYRGAKPATGSSSGTEGKENE